MSKDKRITKDLIETLEDGKDGFAHAADRLASSDRADLAPKMREYSEQRAQFSQELETLAARYGDDIEENGSMAASVHRAWMSMKDTITGADPDGVLDVAEQGEDHAVAEYRKALDEDDLSPELRALIQRQFEAIQRTHDDVRALRDRVS